MKKSLLTLVAFALAMTGARASVVINATNFPDENFRNWVLSQDFGKDGVLTDDEIAGVSVLNLGMMRIYSHGDGEVTVTGVGALITKIREAK